MTHPALPPSGSYIASLICLVPFLQALSEILGHWAVDKDQLYLEPNADGGTTVTATSWYRLFVAPAVSFDWWATDIARNIHRRVLSQVKRLAEADWRREHPEKNPKASGS
jgi:hypothetical protein